MDGPRMKATQKVHEKIFFLVIVIMLMSISPSQSVCFITRLFASSRVEQEQRGEVQLERRRQTEVNEIFLLLISINVKVLRVINYNNLSSVSRRKAESRPAGKQKIYILASMLQLAI